MIDYDPNTLVGASIQKGIAMEKCRVLNLINEIVRGEKTSIDRLRIELFDAINSEEGVQ